MRGCWDVKGFRNDHMNNNLFNKTTFQVNYTADKIGKTLSIADKETGIQFSIPFDAIYKEITK